MSEVEKAMRGSSAYYGEEERVALLNAALVEAHDNALEEQAAYFDSLMATGDTEPLSPRAVAVHLRSAKSPKAVAP